MTRIAFILALLFTAPLQEAEIVEVSGVGMVDLKPFRCQDITRSSVVSRVCHDEESGRLLVQHHATYRQFDGLSKPVVDAFLDAPSMGQFLRACIERAGESRPPSCPSR